eukprot:7416032-Pyramimonas_sp.AAC.1
MRRCSSGCEAQRLWRGGGSVVELAVRPREMQGGTNAEGSSSHGGRGRARPSCALAATSAAAVGDDIRAGRSASPRTGSCLAPPGA